MASATSMNGRTIREVLGNWASQFESTLETMLTPDDGVPAILVEAVRYSVQSGGKRVRPYIVTRICELCGGTAEQAAPAAVAMECVHAFSLVHDDLPAMDDDELRRGRPTCHKAYGEAVAILAGDALLALAFEILTTKIDNPQVASSAVRELACGCGWAGMIGGQTVDIISEQKAPGLSLVKQIHRYKTARLFECSARLGAISACADQACIEAAAVFGQQLGRGFQIADDILDVIGNQEQVGKAVAKDAQAGKQTYPAAAGMEASRRAAEETIEHAIKALEVFGPKANDLRQLAKFVIERDR